MEKDFLAAYIVELWKKRYIIIIVGICCAILTAVFCKFIAKEIFECSAQVYIRQKPNYTNAEREDLNPLTYEILLKSPSLLNEVRIEYCKKVKKTPPMLELFIKGFKVKTTMVEDTTIRKKLSPVIEVSVTDSSRQNAKILMDTWTTIFIKRFGDTIAKDAEYISDYFEQRLKEIQSSLETKEKEYSDIKWQLPTKIKQLSDAEDLLSPGRMFYPVYQKEPKILGPYNYQDVNVQVQPMSISESGQTSNKVGLREQLKRHELKIQTAKSKGENIKDLTIELNALNQVIKDTENEIHQLQNEVSLLEQKYEATGREVDTLKQQYQLTSSMFSQTNLEARAINKEGKTEFEGSDVLVISPAVMPDKRIFPRFTIFTIASFILGIFLCTIVLIVRKYIFDAQKIELEQNS